MEFKLKKLNYEYNSLEPIIDEKTMIIHHTKHHNTYITNMNNILNNNNLEYNNIEELVLDLENITGDFKQALINNAGGHFNHEIFFDSLINEKESNIEDINEELTTLITNTFGSFEEFKTNFVNAGLTRFGSGWVWLVLNNNKELVIKSYLNQDPALTKTEFPLFGVDVWEHAYYLNYQNLRADYLNNIFKIINWKYVNNRFENALKYFNK